MRLTRLSSGSRFEDLAGYSRAVVVEHDRFAEVLVSGCTGFEPVSMTIPDHPLAQARQAFANIESALAEAGGGLEHLVRVRYMIADAALWPILAPVFGELMQGVRPAATCIVCGLIDPRMLVEIEGDARIPRAARALVLLLAPAIWLAGCATPGTPKRMSCPAGQSRATTAEMVFGRDVSRSLGVSDADWAKFLDEEITPRFPDGLSVMDVQGQWRASNGQMVREPSKVLFLVLDGGPDDPAKIAHIRDAYKASFHQDSVLLLTRQACVSF